MILPAAVLVNVPLLVMVSGPPPVVVIAAPRITLFVEIEIPEAPVVTSAPLKVVVPVLAVCAIEAAAMPWVVTFTAPLMLKAPMGTPDPTFELIVIEPPLESKLKLDPPSIVPKKVMLPPPVLKSKIEGAKRVNGLVINRLPWMIDVPPAKKGPEPI